MFYYSYKCCIIFILLCYILLITLRPIKLLKVTVYTFLRSDGDVLHVLFLKIAMSKVKHTIIQLESSVYTKFGRGRMWRGPHIYEMRAENIRAVDYGQAGTALGGKRSSYATGTDWPICRECS